MSFLLLMAGTYIWSGLHKVNPTFFEFWGNGLNKRIPFVPETLRQLFTWSVPFLEACFGIALLFNKTRKIGIVLLIFMHLSVLITLTYSGAGFIVFPLNIINPLLLIMLGYSINWSVMNFNATTDLKLKLVALYALIIPALNLVGRYDHLLSFSYFSGKPEYCNIVFLDQSKTDNLPNALKDMLRPYEDTYYINVNEWSVKYTNVLCYPEKRVYYYLQNYVEEFSGNNTTKLQFYK